jgi:two-component system response regulator HydG
VRELQNTIERAIVLAKTEVIGIDDLPPVIARAVRDSAPDSDTIVIPYGMTLEAIERLVIERTLQRTGGDKKLAARLLGIAARTIYRKL